jgi:S-adenosyl methyltransferase
MDEWLRKAARPVMSTQINARRTLDLSQPVALLMIGVLNFIEGPGRVVPPRNAAFRSGRQEIVKRFSRRESPRHAIRKLEH